MPDNPQIIPGMSNRLMDKANADAAYAKLFMQQFGYAVGNAPPPFVDQYHEDAEAARHIDTTVNRIVPPMPVTAPPAAPDTSKQELVSTLQTIKDRAAQQQQSDLSVSQHFVDKGDPTYSRHVFSLRGPVSSADHQAAIDHYNETGNSPPGFTVLAPGVMQKLRSGFESTVGDYARSLGEYKTPVAHLLDKVFGEGTGAKYDPAMGVNKIISDRLSTPEKTAATAAQLTAGALTGGTAPLVQAGITAASTAAAYIGTQAATGSPLSLGKAGIEAAVSGLTQGVSGIAKNLANKSIDKLSADKIETDLVNLAKDQYGHLPVNQYKINSIASTPSGAQAITSVLNKNYHSQIDSVTSNISLDINKMLPTALSVGDQNTLRAQVRAMTRAAHKMYDSVGDTSASSLAKGKYNDAVAGALGIIKTAHPDDLKIQQLVADRLSKSSRLVESMIQNGEVASAMHKAGMAQGFDRVAFQRTVLGMNVTPKSPLEQAGLLMNMPARSSGNIPAATSATSAASAINSFLGGNK